jgi:hypothetical protein
VLFKDKLTKLSQKPVITVKVKTPSQFHKQRRVLVHNTSAAATVLNGSKI